jgi:glutathione S-transferase
VLRLYGFRYSTNAERVTLALAHKGIRAELVPVDPGDRSAVRAVSGQDLVPVIDDDGTIVADSTAILYHLERRFPERPLFPADPARRAEMDVFLDWFNRVWKRPPNVITDELEKPAPDGDRLARMDAEMDSVLATFEGLLAGREHLMGNAFTAADCAAWPFLRYATMPLAPDDDHLFHQVLYERQAAVREGRHPRLAAWIDRVAAHPRQEF